MKEALIEFQFSGDVFESVFLVCIKPVMIVADFLRENKIIQIFQGNCIECEKGTFIKIHAFNKKKDLAASGKNSRTCV
jgi:hypothetical protein